MQGIHFHFHAFFARSANNEHDMEKYLSGYPISDFRHNCSRSDVYWDKLCYGSAHFLAICVYSFPAVHRLLVEVVCGLFASYTVSLLISSFFHILSFSFLLFLLFFISTRIFIFVSLLFRSLLYFRTVRYRH